MTKEDKKMNEAQAPAEVVEERPNRKAYQEMFAEDYPDVDFEDKEARYGKMIEDRKRYRGLAKSGRGLSAALDKNRWLGAMFQDLAQNPDKDPISWMYDNGIDVQKAMEDEAYRSQVAEGLAKFQQKQAEGEAAAQQKDENLRKSSDALGALQKELGLSDEQCDRMWTHLFKEVVVPAMEGEVSKETWKLVKNALNYDSDMASAREEAGMQARNEKFQNRVKSYDEQQVPPSFSQGTGQSTAPKKKRNSTFDDLKKWGY